MKYDELIEFITFLRNFEKDGDWFFFYPYLVPNGTVPSGQNVGRKEIE